MNFDPTDRLVELIEALQSDGGLSEADFKELEGILENDESAREYYVLSQELHTMLEVDKSIRLKLASDWLPENVIPLPGVDVTEVMPEPKPEPIKVASRQPLKSGFRMATSLAAMVAGLVVMLWIYSEVSEFAEKASRSVKPELLAGDEALVSYHDEVLPILTEHCFECHGEDEVKREADLRLDRLKSALSGDKPAIVPGKPGESEMIARISSHDPEYMMPPKEKSKRLSEAQIMILTKWIEQGAVYGSHRSYSKTRELKLWLAWLGAAN
ncbi:MAG: hypothetical protein P1U89_24410 [Verrucomicrobiales bacterium]|nr:hypothetical protein [Verrucomicrobiales bacterium]